MYIHIRMHTYADVCVCICICTYMTDDISIYLSLYLSIYLRTYLCIYLSIYLSICMYIRLHSSPQHDQHILVAVKYYGACQFKGNNSSKRVPKASM